MTLLIGNRVLDTRNPNRRGELLGLTAYMARVRFDGEGIRRLCRWNLAPVISRDAKATQIKPGRNRQ